MGIRPAPLPGERAIVGMRPARKERMERKRSSIGRQKESLWTYRAVRAYAQRKVLDLKPVRMWAYARALRRACSKDKPSNGERGNTLTGERGTKPKGHPPKPPGPPHTRRHTHSTHNTEHGKGKTQSGRKGNGKASRKGKVNVMSASVQLRLESTSGEPRQGKRQT